MSQILFKVPTVLSGYCQIRSLSTHLRKFTSHPTSVRPSRDEIKYARLSPQNLEVAMRSLHQDGLVVIENAIPHDCLDRLNKKMIEDAYSLQSRKGDSPFNYNPGNIQQDAPPVTEYFEPSIFMSKPKLPLPFSPQLLTLTQTPSPLKSPRQHLDPAQNGHFAREILQCPRLQRAPRCLSLSIQTQTLLTQLILSHTLSMFPSSP